MKKWDSIEVISDLGERIAYKNAYLMIKEKSDPEKINNRQNVDSSVLDPKKIVCEIVPNGFKNEQIVNNIEIVRKKWDSIEITLKSGKKFHYNNRYLLIKESLYCLDSDIEKENRYCYIAANIIKISCEIDSELITEGSRILK